MNRYTSVILFRDLVPQGRRLIVQCNRCRNRRLLRPDDPALAAVDPETPVHELAARMVCSQCGRRDCIVMPETDRMIRQGRER